MRLDRFSSEAILLPASLKLVREEKMMPSICLRILGSSLCSRMRDILPSHSF